MGLYYKLSNGEEIEVRIEQDEDNNKQVTAVLFNGSMTLSYKLNDKRLLNDIIKEIEKDYSKLETEDISFFYQSNGFYD